MAIRLKALIAGVAALLLVSCGGGSSSSHHAATELPVLTVTNTAVEESAGRLQVLLTLSAASAATVAVDYSLLDDTAIAASDYVSSSGTISFAPGETQRTLDIVIINDSEAEADENFYLVLSNADGLVLSSNKVALTILANDSIASLSAYDPHWGIVGAFTEAQTCGNCHAASTDDSGVLRFPKQADGEDISPDAGWKHSVMAHSFDDPFFQAVTAAEAKQFPSLAGTIEDKCLTCHSPMARTHAHTSLTSLSTDACPLDSDGCYRMASAYQQDIAREGISCTLCHQISPDNLGTDFSGKYVIDGSLKIYGPYADVVTMPMQQQTQYTPVAGAHIQRSELCAVCHNLKTPTVNINTNALTGSEFVEQAPYSEWLNSTFNEGDSEDRSCQDCHMPEIAGYTTQIATKGNGEANLAWPERSNYSQHTFSGGNNYLLTLLKNFRDVIGIAASTSVAGFDRQIENNSEFLRAHAAAIAIDSTQLDNDTLAIAVTVTNKAGHKLPTSFPSRRVWINLIVKNAAGEVLFESGTPDRDGNLTVDRQQTEDVCTGNSKPLNFISTYCYEPHRDVITAGDQIAIYEAVMADVNGQVTYTLLYGDHYVKDNRIPPRGFTSAGIHYSDDVAVVGLATSDSNFNNDGTGAGSGTDTVTYRLPWAGLESRNLTVAAKLYYQSIRPGFVAALQHEDDAIARFKWMHEQFKPQPELLAEVELHL